MPTELVPKSKKGTGASLTFFRILFHILLGLSLGLTVSLLMIEVSKNNVKKELKRLEAAVSRNEIQKIRDTEQRLSNLQYKLSVYEDLLSSHKHSSSFFGYLAGLTHRQVSFDKLSFNSADSRAVVSGSTGDFSKLREQILILRKEETIESVDLKKVALGEAGGVSFSLEFSFDPIVLEQKE